MTRFLSLFSFIVLLLVGRPVSFGQTIHDDDYLVRICDTATGDCGYANLKGDTIIPLRKYSMCFTDTFRIYAIVSMLEKGFVAINRQEKILYEVFPFDNGPDYPKEGLFRIRIGNKIGYADEITAKVVIDPQFDCAWPFENGTAKVSTNCRIQSYGEHITWHSDTWFYIDRDGKKAERIFTEIIVAWIEPEDTHSSDVLPVYLDENDPLYLQIKDRVVADVRQRADTGSADNKSIARQFHALSKEKQDEFETLFAKSITDYTSKAHFNIGTYMLFFNELGRMDPVEIENELDIRVQSLNNDTYAAEFWQKERYKRSPKVMVVLYKREPDGSITFQDPFQAAIDFLSK